LVDFAVLLGPPMRVFHLNPIILYPVDYGAVWDAELMAKSDVEDASSKS